MSRHSGILAAYCLIHSILAGAHCGSLNSYRPLLRNTSTGFDYSMIQRTMAVAVYSLYVRSKTLINRSSIRIVSMKSRILSRLELVFTLPL